MFKAWEDEGFFRRVRITDHRAIVWSDEIELRPDALYAELTGLSWEEVYPPGAGIISVSANTSTQFRGEP